MLGHNIPTTTEAYFKADINSLREQYIQCIPSLSIQEVEVQILQSEEKRKL
jgi:hypothetical protein